MAILNSLPKTLHVSPLGPTLETERLILRPPIAEDFEGFCNFFADEATMKLIGGTVTPPVVWRQMRMVAGQWALDGFGMFCALEKATGEMIGRVGPQYPMGWPGREVGWGFLSKSWGKGYALEAAIVCMDYAFDVLGWDAANHVIDAGNAASIKLATKLGSTNGGPCLLPDPIGPGDRDLWGQTREAWSTNRERFLS